MLAKICQCWFYMADTLFQPDDILAETSLSCRIDWKSVPSGSHV